MQRTFTLILNAGGQSRRMGQPKALLPVPPDGTPLLLHMLHRLQPLAPDRIILIANDPALPQKARLPTTLPTLPDAYPDAGPLGGLATGLAACLDWAILVACDLPLVNPALFAWFQELAQTQTAGNDTWDAIVPIVDGHAEPLHALYHPRCLLAIEACLARGERRASSFMQDIRTRYVQEEELRRIDPTLRSFFNTNTPTEWQQALAMLRMI